MSRVESIKLAHFPMLSIPDRHAHTGYLACVLAYCLRDKTAVHIL
jgi:hypothetical protein